MYMLYNKDCGNISVVAVVIVVVFRCGDWCATIVNIFRIFSFLLQIWPVLVDLNVQNKVLQGMCHSKVNCYLSFSPRQLLLNALVLELHHGFQAIS